MASTSDNKTVSFSDTVEHFISENESEEENEYLEDYVEPVSERECRSSSDEDQLELFDKLLEGARFEPSRSFSRTYSEKFVTAIRQRNEDDEYDNSSVYSKISSCSSGIFCSTIQSSQSEGEQSNANEPPSKLSKSVLKRPIWQQKSRTNA